MSEMQYSILILEDNPLDAELAEQRLRAAGFDIETVVADSKARFEVAFAAGSYDLVLADYSLPDFDGVSALDMVRAKNKRLPFIFVSGVLGEDIAVETLLRGATDYVLKQKLDRLAPAVKRALSEHGEFLSRERAEQDLQRVEERFEKLTNNLPAMVWTSDSEGRLTFTNSLWKRCIDPRATCWMDEVAIHASDVAMCNRIWAEAQDSLTKFEIDCRYWNVKDQSYHWHIVRATPIVQDRGTIEWVGTCTDIEMQKLRDAEMKTAERLALAGRMASVVAHEINNPLEALTNIVYLVQSETTPRELVSNLLADAQHELVRMSAITKQTLEWSREEGAISDVSIQALVGEALRLFTAKMRNKNIQVEQDCDSEAMIRAVPGEVRQVLANLLSNAIDAVGMHGRIRVRIREGDAETGLAEIVIEDNGAGIEAGRISELFRPFHSTKGNLGNGLGLYVSKNILDRMGGDLQIESTVNVGTTVRVFVPRAVKNAAVPTGVME
jgi:signal transduction histidine kinase/CheY-like chemotaxis protein